MNFRSVANRVSRLWHRLRSDRHFRKWREDEPDAPYGKFYTRQIVGKLHKGKPHTTLGGRGFLKAGTDPVAWDQASFARRGVNKWQEIIALGLQPEMRCVDYGCGSLRLGQHAMRYLDAGNYYGLDVTDAFINAGLELVDPNLLRDKAPRFGTISAATLQEVREWKPDFIFSRAVLQHVPAEELGLYFERLQAMMVPGSQAFILYIAGERVERFGAMSWSFPPALVRAAVQSGAPSLAIVASEIPQGQRRDGRPRLALHLEFPDGP